MRDGWRRFVGVLREMWQAVRDMWNAWDEGDDDQGDEL
jgi:hypothetical protein